MAKKKAKKEEKNNVIVEKIQKASETVTEKIKDYNEKYLADTIEKGKKTFKDYNEKYVSQNVEKGKETIKEYNEKYIVKNFEKGKEYFDGPYKKISETVEDVLKKTPLKNLMKPWITVKSLCIKSLWWKRLKRKSLKA